VDLPSALHQAEQVRAAGNRDRALALVREILAIHGDVYEAHEIAARCHLSKRAYDEAVESAEAALRASPTGLEARRLLGVAHVKKGELGRAIDVFDELIGLAPEIPHGYFWKGVALRLMDRGVDARAAFLEALTCRDESFFVEALCELAVLDVLSARPRQSLHSAMSAVEMEPESATAHRALAICHYESGRYTASLAALDDARRLSPESDWSAWLDARYRAVFGAACSWFRGWARAPFLVADKPWRPRAIAVWLTFPLLAAALPALGLLQIANTMHAESRYGRARENIQVDAEY
jgi:tetratricopeptide (TPR) repeat protein